MLVHRIALDAWQELPGRVGLQSAQQFWDHVARAPGHPPTVGRSTILRGKAGEPQEPGFSRTVHYEISGAGRIDYQYHDSYVTSPTGDPHRVVRILTVNLSSH